MFSQSAPIKPPAPPRSYSGPGAGLELGPVKVPVNGQSGEVPAVEKWLWNAFAMLVVMMLLL